MSKTKFEEQLNQYFPEMSEIYALSKKDKKVWTVFKEMVKMSKKRSFGNIKIGYQEGRINGVVKTTSIQ